MRIVRVTVPATTANLGPGFDSLALALGLHNTVELSEVDEGLVFNISGEGADSLPRDGSNLVVRAARAVFRAAGRAPGGLRVRLSNGIPLASGLGSSAAALLGGVVAANALLDRPLNREDLLKVAVELEGHPDNVTAALLGGLVISSYDGASLVYKSVTLQPLQVVVVLPDVSLSTGAARDALPEKVPLSDAAQNVGRAALVVQALVEGDYGLLGEAMRDRLHEPYRRKLIPGFDEASQAARSKGAAAVAISGAGPALVAFTGQEHEAVASAAAQAFREVTGRPARSWILPVDTQGIAISEMATEMPLSSKPAKGAAREGAGAARPLGLGEAAELLRRKADADKSSGEAESRATRPGDSDAAR